MSIINSTSVSWAAGTPEQHSNSRQPQGLVLRACQGSAKLSFVVPRESTKQPSHLQVLIASNFVTLQQSLPQLSFWFWSACRDKGWLQELGAHQAGAMLATKKAGGSQKLSHPVGKGKALGAWGHADHCSCRVYTVHKPHQAHCWQWNTWNTPSTAEVSENKIHLLPGAAGKGWWWWHIHLSCISRPCCFFN